MILASIVLFALAAIGGAILAVLLFSDRPLPMILAIGHGILAATGLVLLIIASVNHEAAATMTKVSLILFLVAAVGGFVLFSFHLRSKALPRPLVIVHGGVAVVAFIMLLLQAT